MDNRFIPYVGKEKYIFLSYSRGDTNQMLSVARFLYEKHYRLWYDEGIPPGDDWAADIAEHMENAGTVIFFLSARSLVSPNCFSEVKTACDMGKKLVCVLCDGCSEMIRSASEAGRELTSVEASTVKELCMPYYELRKDKSKIPLPGLWVPLFESAAFIDGNNGNYSGQADDILSSGLLDSSYTGSYSDGSAGKIKKNGWIFAIVLSFALFAAAVAGVWAIQTGRVILPGQAITSQDTYEETSPVPVSAVDSDLLKGLFGTVTFPDELQASAVSLVTDIDSGSLEILKEELVKVHELHVCGNMAVASDTGIVYSGGRWYLNGAPVVQGEIKDLSVIGQMYYLESLTLVYQSISGFKALSELPLLRSLNLAGNPVTEIPALDGFPALEELNLSHTGVRDLSGLDGLASLKRVYVTSDMLPLDSDPEAEYEIILVY